MTYTVSQFPTIFLDLTHTWKLKSFLFLFFYFFLWTGVKFDLGPHKLCSTSFQVTLGRVIKFQGPGLFGNFYCCQMSQQVACLIFQLDLLVRDLNCKNVNVIARLRLLLPWDGQWLLLLRSRPRWWYSYTARGYNTAIWFFLSCRLN